MVKGNDPEKYFVMFGTIFLSPYAGFYFQDLVRLDRLVLDLALVIFIAIGSWKK